MVACGGSSAAPPTSSGSDGGGTSEDSGTVPSDGSVSDSATLGDGSASQACADWAAARCQRYDACSDALYNQIHYGSEAACVTASVQTCAIGLAATGTAATAETFEACAQALPTESCADFLGDNPVSACAALAGTLAIGAPCIGSSQCQSTYCAIPQYATCGVCAAVPAAGSPCVVTAECGARGGLACAEGVCVAYGGANASCSGAAPCGIGFDCVGAKKTAPGTCQPTVTTVGATCVPDRFDGTVVRPDAAAHVRHGDDDVRAEHRGRRGADVRRRRRRDREVRGQRHVRHRHVRRRGRRRRDRRGARADDRDVLGRSP